MNPLRMTNASKSRLIEARNFCIRSHQSKESIDYMLTMAYYRGANDMETALKVVPLEKKKAPLQSRCRGDTGQ